MGFLNEIKKLVFSAKSVAKSQAEKAAEKGKEMGEEVRDKAGDALQRAKSKAEDFTAEVSERAEDLFETAKEKAEDIGSKIWEETEKAVNKAKEYMDGDKKKETELASMGVEKEEGDPNYFDDDLVPENKDANIGGGLRSAAEKAKNAASKIGDELMERTAGTRKAIADTAEKVGGQVLDTAETVGEKLIEKSDSFWDKAQELGGRVMDKAEEIGGRVMDKADDLVNKAQEETSKESIDDIIDQANNANADLEAKVNESDKLFSESIKEDSGLGKHDSFFDRAQRFADGDYHNDGADKRKKGEMEIKTNPDYKPNDKKKDQTVPGFEDLDGDGNEIIDDAILDDE